MLFNAISILGPATIPLASGLLGISAGFVGIGEVALPALLGIKKEITDNTALGRAYGAELQTLKTSFSQLEHTAAAGVLKPFQAIVRDLNMQMPQFNSFLAKTSPLVGSIGQHLIGGFVGMLKTMEPLIVTAEGAINKMAIGFEHWATGAGGASFFSKLATDIPTAIHFIAALGTTVSKLVQAFAPIGGVVLNSLTGFLTGLNWMAGHLPGVTQALVTFFVAFRVASVIGAATAALTKFAAAETAVAVATAEGEAAAGAGAAGRVGLAKRLAGGAAALGPYVAGAVAFTIVARTAADATSDWATSTSKLKQAAHGALDVLSLNFGNLGNDNRAADYGNKVAATQREANVFGREQLEFNKRIFSYQLAQDTQNLGRYSALFAKYKAQAAATGGFGKGLGASERATAEALGMSANTNRIKALGAVGADQANIDQQQKSLDQITQATDRYTAAVSRSNDMALAQARAATDSIGAISKAPAIYSQLDTAINSQIKAEEKFKSVASDQGITVNGTTYSLEAYAAASQQAGGDVYKMQGILKGHTEALKLDKAALAQSQLEQYRLNAAIGMAEGLTNKNAKSVGLTAEQVDLYANALGIATSKVADGTVSAKAFAEAIDNVRDKLNNADTSVAAWVASADKFTKSGQSAADTASLIAAAFQAGRGPALDWATANLDGASAAEAAATALDKNRASVGANGKLLGQLTKTSHGYVILQPQLTKGSLEIASALTQQALTAQNAAAATYQNERATKGNKVAAHDAIGVYKGYRDQLISTMTQMGYSAPVAQKLADNYLAIPKNVDTFVKQLGAGDVKTAIGDLTVVLGHLDRDIRMSLHLDDGGALNRIIDIGNHAYALAHTSYAVTIGTGRPASGGATGRYITQGTGPTADDVPIMVSKGEYVINAAQTAKHFDLLDNLNKGTKGFATGGYVPPSLLVTTPSGMTGSGPTTSGGVGGTAPSGTTASRTGTTASRPRYVNPQIAILLTRIHHDVAAMTTISKRSAALQNKYSYGLSHYRSDLASANAGAAQEKATVAGAITGGFDIGTSGNGYRYGIQATLNNKLADARKFEALRDKAIKLGLDPRLIKQISEEGPGTAGKNLEAIVGGGSSYIKTLNKTYGQFVGIANETGSEQARDTYGKRQAADTVAIRRFARLAHAEQVKTNNELILVRREIATLQRALVIARRSKG